VNLVVPENVEVSFSRDYGLSELNLEDSNSHPIMINPSRSRVSSRLLSQYHSAEEEDDRAREPTMVPEETFVQIVFLLGDESRQ
jgi:hypothetical protein